MSARALAGFLGVLLVPATQERKRGRLEARVEVVRVVDGDTLDVRILEVPDQAKEKEAKCKACLRFQQDSRRKRGWAGVEGDTHVRLSGNLDAPEWETPGGKKAKEFLKDLIDEADEVWLDIDDRGGDCRHHKHAYRDKYCRLLAVVWVRHGKNWTELARALVEKKLADIRRDWKFPTEFDLSRPWQGAPEPAPSRDEGASRMRDPPEAPPSRAREQKPLRTRSPSAAPIIVVAGVLALGAGALVFVLRGRSREGG